jgi:hypothetical protein
VLGLFRKAKVDREALLSAIPLRNELVREKAVAEGAGGLRLTAPLKPSALRKVFAARGGAAPEKSFELDDLGTWVWRAMDGKRDVEDLIRGFAGHFRVNLREAEVSVLAFLKTLAQRNLIGLLAPKRP